MGNSLICRAPGELEAGGVSKHVTRQSHTYTQLSANMMFSRTFLFSSARVLLAHSRCSQAALLEGGWIPLTGRGTAIAPFSISSVLRDTPSKPGKSGDKGPEKNYRKKILKKQKKEMGQQPPPPGSDLDALLKEMKLMETQPQAQSVPAGHIASLMKGASGGNVGARRPMLNQRTE